MTLAGARLALLTAATLGTVAQGLVQERHGRSSSRSSPDPLETEVGHTAVPSEPSGERQGGLVLDATTSSLLQQFMALSRNKARLTSAMSLGNLTSDIRGVNSSENGSSHWMSSERAHILEAISEESAVFVQGMRTRAETLRDLGKATDSAALLAWLAEQSANRTGRALEAAPGVLASEMRALEQLSTPQDFKAGRTHVLPHMHVAGRGRFPGGSSWGPHPGADAGGSHLGGRPSGEGEQIPVARTHAEKGSPPKAQSQEPSAGSLSLRHTPAIQSVGVESPGYALALTGVGLVFLSMFMTAGRMSLPSVAKAPPGHSIGGEADKQALSVWDGTVSTFSAVVGSGLLAMPYAFSIAGLFAVPLIGFFAACSAYTAHLMAWAMTSQAAEADQRGINREKRGWGFLMEAAFGRRAKCATNAFLIVELWGYLLSTIVCSGMNITQMSNGIDAAGAIGISVTAAFMLTFVDSSILTKVNVVSNGFFVVCCIMFVITGLRLPTKAPSSEIQFIKPSGLITAAGILVYSPAAHSFYPAIMQRMEEPAKFPVCLRRAYSGAMVVYLTVALSGYWLFGNAAQPSLVQNIGADLRLIQIPDLGWMNTVAALCMVSKMLAQQCLCLGPLSNTVENVLVGCLPEPVATAAVAPGIMLISAAVAVHFAHEMAQLLNIIGSVFCMNIAFVMPVLSYWKLTKEPVSSIRQMVFISLMVMGGTFSSMGLLSNL
mmetsp:Transcript_28687/g.60868  ORF Transcript_28687/g.60868 Transcript_28687/m.60868 type:complete len:718 (+) Transcript_28687:200-2353(+)